MFCVNCGKDIIEGAMFCRFCGQPVKSASVPQYQQPPSPAVSQPAAPPNGYVGYSQQPQAQPAYNAPLPVIPPPVVPPPVVPPPVAPFNNYAGYSQQQAQPAYNAPPPVTPPPVVPPPAAPFNDYAGYSQQQQAQPVYDAEPTVILPSMAPPPVSPQPYDDGGMAAAPFESAVPYDAAEIVDPSAIAAQIAQSLPQTNAAAVAEPNMAQPGSTGSAQGPISALPLEERRDCPVCSKPSSGVAGHVSIVSGKMTKIGKDKEKNDLFYKEPTQSHRAPFCHGCMESSIGKIKRRRPLNCILSILCWPIGIALIICGIAIVFSDNVGIVIGNFRIIPWVFIFILCLPGIAVIVAAVHTGKRGFTNPDRLFVSDAEEKLKSKVLSELKDQCAIDKKNTVFTATMKEADGLQALNSRAYAACKYPAPIE